MVALPQRPIAPVLLIVAGLCILLAILIQFLSFAYLRQIRFCRKTPDEIRNYPHPAFLCLLLPAFILSIAAASLERYAISQAMGVWNVSLASDIGMTAEMGPIAHRTSSPGKS
jgi:hypothetical protein